MDHPIVAEGGDSIPFACGEKRNVAADPIITGATKNPVSAGSALDQVRFGVAIDGVVSVAARKQITAIGTGCDRAIVKIGPKIARRVRVKEIIAAPARDHVPPGSTFDHVISNAAPSSIVAIPKRKPIVAPEHVLHDVIAAAHKEPGVARRTQ